MHDFTAIDFETAQGPRWSACAIGLVHYKDGEPVYEYESLIRPPGNIYHPINIDIHGITPDHTKNAREFPDIWKEIGRYVLYQTVVAHNVSFDEDVLIKSLSYYNLPVPNFKCQCTFRIYGYKLIEVCDAFGIPLKHHNALSDAKACGQLYLNHLNGIQPVKPIYHEEDRQIKEYHEHIHGDVLKPDLERADPGNFFYGKKVVITGVFEHFERNRLAEELKNQGADVDTSVNKKTHYVIAGKEPGYKKMELVNTLQQQGFPVQIIGEDVLVRILNL